MKQNERHLQNSKRSFDADMYLKLALWSFLIIVVYGILFGCVHQPPAVEPKWGPKFYRFHNAGPICKFIGSEDRVDVDCDDDMASKFVCMAPEELLKLKEKNQRCVEWR